MRIAAIAFLVVRTAVRSRAVLCLAFFLLLILGGLPLTVEGDGTAEGEVRVLLEYTLGLSIIALGIVMLAFSGGAVAREIEDRHIQLLAVKPVRGAQIWLGKWLGLLILSAVMLTVIGAAVYGGIWWVLRAEGYDREQRQALRKELLTARIKIAPLPEDVAAEVQERLQRLAGTPSASGRLPRGELVRMLGRRVLAERATVAPGSSKIWNFPRALDIPGGRTARLRFRLAPTIEPGLISGTWLVGGASRPDAVKIPMSDALERGNYIDAPTELIAAEEPLRVEFRNGPPGETGTAVFDYDAGVELLVKDSGFGINLLRSLIVVFCYLALLSALGLTAGCLFSSPVAGFISAALVFFALMGNYITLRVDDTVYLPHGEDAAEVEHSRLAGFLDTAGRAIVRRTEIIFEPALSLNPLEGLADGLLISWRFTAKAVLLLGIVYPAVLGIAGTWALWKREMALPGD